MVLSLLAAGWCTTAAFTGRRLNELARRRRCV
jgi:hypothetical protein